MAAGTWLELLDLRNLLTVSRAIAMAAKQRKESRGAHFRDDYPDKDPQLGKITHVIVKNDEGKMVLRADPVAEIPDELQQIIKDNE